MLREVTLRLPRGKVTALVGHSGAGKSTVAALISRFYEPERGDLALGGTPAAAFTRGEWARAVALVSQEPILFRYLLKEGSVHSLSFHTNTLPATVLSTSCLRFFGAQAFVMGGAARCTMRIF